MANLAYQRVELLGSAVTMSAASAGGDLIPGNGSGFLVVSNGSAASINVTVVTPGVTQFGVDQPDVVVAVPAGATRYIGPLRSDLVNSTDKAIRVNYSATASVTVAAVTV